MVVRLSLNAIRVRSPPEQITPYIPRLRREEKPIAYTSVIAVHRLDSAVRYVLDEKKCSRSTNAESLEGVLGQALNQDQSEQDLFRSAIGCTIDSAFEDMCQIKKIWHKEKGVQGFHLVQSFAPGEISPELAHQIGMEFADRLLGGKFQAVVSTHLNTKCIHNHIVWNSVSMENGKKYRSNEKTYVTEVRRISDELCQTYSLSVIQTKKSERVGRPYALWLAEQNGMPTWKTAIRQDIDAAIADSFTWKQFVRSLENRGYTVRLDRKYPALKPPGKERAVRFKTLGKRYTPQEIRERILYPKPPHRAGKENRPANSFLLLLGEKPSRKLSGLQALYFSYLFKMGILPKKPRYPSFAVRQDIRKLDQRIEQAEFIFQNHIEDRGQLAAIRQKSEDEIAVLLKERRKLYRYQPNSPQIGVLTEQLKKLRYTVKLCRKIETHSVEIEQRLQEARTEEQQRQEQLAQEEKKKETRNQENQKRR
ncbi:relaxase/mobilization nuclease domain-containing protein [Massiliimalia timonensis]|uniref:relaxase/mobilization nuclease domain-containing protein n=1 Tax=Massiliimalia timonensis TaxID=1987501 RepID=UPI0038994075